MALVLQYQIADVTPSGETLLLDIRLMDKAAAKQVGQVYVTADLAAIAAIKSDPALTVAQKTAAIKTLIQSAVAAQTLKMRDSLMTNVDLTPLKGLAWDA